MSTAANFRNVKMSACDRISDLPSSIIESILMWLPTRDAARTSILSRKWRYNWSRIPQLVLDDKIFNKILTNHALPRQKFAEILFQILSLHQGPISKFRCSLTGLKDCRDIDSLIVLLSRSGVREFTLNLWLNEYHRMPLAFFSCLELRHLNLRGCLIKPPTNFQGFGHLIRLKLCQVNIAEDVLGSLMSSSLLLEQLTVVEIPAILNSLELIAPKLKSVSSKAL
ncbi:F-box/FBD/LRR-repeat protein At1g13570-like [Coffea arabica]|uniref:F-box/FBD/LRR-repeat protein At1g13570-like n=1 Tax=Coffea arabica TaxID=13443 RepID=A0A6P6UDM0_COFAR|nr:F-box/FBD/LRR-repeat protein At1g13570-like [Coffea arabica]